MSYYVKRSSGKVLGPFKSRIIEGMIRSKQVNAETEVSVDKESWQPLGSLEDFAGTFGESFQGASARSKRATDTPSARATLPVSKEKTAFGFNLPRTKGDDKVNQDAETPLPMPKGGKRPPTVKSKFKLDLPKSKEQEDGMSMPRPKSFAELPAVKKKRPDLPTLKSAADLPIIRGGGDDLPAEQGGDLPMDKDDDALPAPRSFSQLGIKKGKQDGETTQMLGRFAMFSDGSSPENKAVNISDLPSASDEELPLLQNSGETALAFEDGGGGDDIPLLGDDDDDLMGFGGGDDGLLLDDNDDFLMGSGSSSGSSSGADDDLLDFGGGGGDDFLMGNEPGGADDDLLGFDGGGSGGDDLLDFGGGGGDDFLMGNEPGGDDDFLLGNQPGVDDDFLLGNEPDDDDPLGFGSGDDGDDPLGLGAGDDDDPLGLSDEPAEDFHPFEEEESGPPPPRRDGGGPSLAAPGTARSSNYLDREEDEEDDVIDLEPQSRPESPKPRASEDAPSVGSVPTPPAGSGEKSKLPMILGGVLVVALLGLVGAGFAGIGPLAGVFGGDEVAQPGQGGGATGAAQAPVDIHPDSVAKDTFARYERFIEEAEAKLSETGSAKVRGVLLGVIALEMVRYPEMSGVREARARQLLSEINTNAAPEDEIWQDFGRGAWQAYVGNQEAAAPHLERLSKDPEVSYFGNLLRGVASMREAEGAETEDAAQALRKKAEEHLQRAQKDAKAGPAAGYLLGQLRLEMDQPGKAKKSFEGVLESAPEHAGAHLGMARVLMEDGETAAALDHIKPILDSQREGAEADAGSYANSELATAYLLSGRDSLARDDTDLAISEFQKALSFVPGDAEIIAELGDTYYRWQRFDEGIQYFEESYGAKADEDIEVILALVKAYIGKARRLTNPEPLYKQAEARLDTARQRFESEPRIPYWQAVLLEEQGNLAAAEAALRIAVDSDPNFLLAKIRLVSLLTAKETKESRVEASEIVTELLEGDLNVEELSALGRYLITSPEATDREQGRDLLVKATQTDVRWVPAHEALADYYVEQGEAEKALESLSKVDQFGALRPEDRYNRARAYFLQEDYKAAAETMEELLELVKSEPRYFYFAGRAYFARESYPTALTYFKKARELDQNFWPAVHYIGRSQLELGEHKQALEILRNAHEQNKDNGEYHFYYGYAMEKMGRAGEAIREYKRLLTNASEEPPEAAFALKSPLPRWRRGHLYRLKRRPDQARADLERALELQPDFMPAREDLVLVLYEDTAYAKAAEEAEELGRMKAAKGEDLDADLYYVLGMTYLKLKQPRDALAALERARDKGFVKLEEHRIGGINDPAELHETLAFLYRDVAGNKGDAVRSLTTYLNEADRLRSSKRREACREIQRLAPGTRIEACQ